MRIRISIRRDLLDEESMKKLRTICSGKVELFKRAFGADELAIEDDPESGRISFPWFKSEGEKPDPEETKAYSVFITKLIEMAKQQKRANNTKDKPVENEKYAMRCFLIRLGMKGDEYKTARKIILKNLTGSSSFKNGRKAGNENETL